MLRSRKLLVITGSLWALATCPLKTPDYWHPPRMDPAKMEPFVGVRSFLFYHKQACQNFLHQSAKICKCPLSIVSRGLEHVIVTTERVLISASSSTVSPLFCSFCWFSDSPRTIQTLKPAQSWTWALTVAVGNHNMNCIWDAVFFFQLSCEMSIHELPYFS